MLCNIPESRDIFYTAYGKRAHTIPSSSLGVGGLWFQKGVRGFYGRWVHVSGGGGDAGSSREMRSISPGEFVKEARYDLEIAEMMLRYERFKPEMCGGDEDTFYLGRRVLYMLQQALEKAAKAYYSAFFRVVVDNLANLARFCGRVNPRARDVEARLRNLSNRLEPLRVSHAPHRTLVEIMKAFVDPKNGEVLASCAEVASGFLLRGFEKLKTRYPQIKREMEEIETWVIEYARNAIASLKWSNPVEFKSPGNIPMVPPCIDCSILNSLREWRVAKLKEIIDRSEEKLREEVKRLRAIAPALTKVLASIGGMNESEAESLVNSYLGKASVLRYILFTNYLAPFIIYVYPCLHWYEEGGRYPDSRVHEHVLVREKRREICRDLENIEQLIEEIKYIVEEVEKSVGEYEALLRK